MMWNYMLGVLPLGGTAVLFDGSPAFPDMRTLWRFAADVGVTYFGTSAPFIHASMKAGMTPADDADLGRLRAIGSTGAPLSPQGFTWIMQALQRSLPVQSVSGGTDLCTAFVQSCPLLPVRAGELQCPALGAKVEAFDTNGTSVVGEVGELVITRPLPSMPLYSGTTTRRRYRGATSTFPGVGGTVTGSASTGTARR